MPFILALKLGHALSGYGIGDDERGFPKDCFGLLHCRINIGKIVSAYFNHMPVERFPFLLQRIQRHDILRIAVNLYVIAVNDGNKIVQLFACGQLCRFPHFATLLFPIGHERIKVTA